MEKRRKEKRHEEERKGRHEERKIKVGDQWVAILNNIIYSLVMLNFEFESYDGFSPNWATD